MDDISSRGEDNPLCAECSPDGIEEERAYWAWRESAESAGHLQDAAYEEWREGLTDVEL